MSQLLAATDRQFVVAAQLTSIKAKCYNTYLNYTLFRSTHVGEARAFLTVRLPACHENCLGNNKVLAGNLASRFPSPAKKSIAHGNTRKVKKQKHKFLYQKYILLNMLIWQLGKFNSF